jgi:hypothetical protein
MRCRYCPSMEQCSVSLPRLSFCLCAFDYQPSPLTSAGDASTCSPVHQQRFRRAKRRKKGRESSSSFFVFVFWVCTTATPPGLLYTLQKVAHGAFRGRRCCRKVRAFSHPRKTSQRRSHLPRTFLWQGPAPSPFPLNSLQFQRFR